MKPSLPPRQPVISVQGSGAQAYGIISKWWVLIAVGISTFMSALDTSVVNTVLPVIRNSFHTEVDTVEWVVIIYLLMVSGLLLSFGRLGDLSGHRRVFLAGFLIFIVSSLLCGLAPSTLFLILSRALQALGAAMLSANSPAILTKSFPPEQRGQALGLQATMTYTGLTVGPSLGGWLTDLFSWRAVFFINIPVGLLAFLLSWRFVPHDHPHEQVEAFDRRGAMLFMAGLMALLLGLNQGHAWGWLSPRILGLLGVAAGLLVLFVLLERRAPSPMLDLSLFRSPVFSASTASAVFNYICVYSILFLMPFYLIQGRQMSPSQAGLLLSAMPIVMALVAPVSGTLSDRIGVRLPSTLGMGLLAAGLGLLARLGAQASHAQIGLALAVAGLGIGIFISPNNSALLGAAPRQRQGIASGILATARSVGMVLGVGLAGAIYTTVLAGAGNSANSTGTAIFTAIQTSFLVTVVVALLGALTSQVHGNGKK